MTKKMEKIVPDTSILISGTLTDMIEDGRLDNIEILIPEFVVEEMRAQASRGREIGFKGLEEMKKLRKSNKIKLNKIGRRQTEEEIRLAKYGRIDALIMDVAKKNKATLYTGDRVQALVAEAEGIKVEYFEPYKKKKKLKIEKMLTKETMSLHLKEDTIPLAKRGKPGSFKLIKISKKKTSEKDIENMIKEIMDAARYEDDSFVEIGGYSASIVQLGDMRIAIARKPFSDGVELTVVRPTTKLSIDDYKLSDKMKKRISEKTEGLLIAGPPGSGKSTLAAGLAEFLEANGRITKTLESPRDLQVKNEITQYGKLKGSFENTADMLLLVRPDYVIFDEIRKTKEFEIFSDMRLAGIGMVGVVHATEAIDAIQRFITRAELGMIPSIIDTVIYVKDGKIKCVYNITMTVRTPTGMTEADLARPIVEIRDFETNDLKYEIYTYGEENVIMPVKEEREHAVNRLAKIKIMEEIRRFDKNAEIEIHGEKAIVMVDNDKIPILIGKNGKTVKELEERLGISIDISPKVSTTGRPAEFEHEETGAYIIFTLSRKFKGKNANFYSGDDYIFSATVGKEGQIRVSKDSELGKEIFNGLIKDRVKIFI